MKAFNIAASQIWMPNIPMPAIPAGSYYGRVKINYTVKFRDGVDFVYDKNGHTVYNKNGTPKMRVRYKTANKCHVMTYIITDTIPVNFPNGSRAYNAWVQYDDRDSRWIHTTLIDNACLENLNAFICRRVRLVEDDLPEPAKNQVQITTKLHHCTPKRKQVQKEYLYRARFKSR